ncbi:RNA polymerase sigma factor [Methyloligella sp. GL2]|nr:RNA polymerase sigma factor [Methyloligella sp. GL2]QKP78831.1 RNA polymerase sigma factor [Methyloligella sp. GL2]
MSARLTAVFMSRRQALMGNVMRIVRDPQVAEDLAQETYLRARRAIEAGPIRHLEAFLNQTARNLAFDYIRHRRVRDRFEDRDIDHDNVVAVADEIPSAEEALIEKERLRHFDAALKSLPPRVRQAWKLSQVDGWSYAQIAEHLGVSRNTVYNDVKRALGHCYDALRRFETR